MRLELKLLKFMIGKENACQRQQERSVRFQVMNYLEWCGERQRLHYLFIWALYNIVNCDVLKWIQIWGSVMRTYWISARGRLNPPGSPHISHPALPLSSWHSGGKWHHPHPSTSSPAPVKVMNQTHTMLQSLHFENWSRNKKTTFTGCPNTYQA